MTKYFTYDGYQETPHSHIGVVPSHWKLKRAKYLFDRQCRLPRECDETVTAFRDGQVTLRANRRTDGFTESIKEIGYQGVRCGDLVVHAMDGFAGAIGVSDSDGKCTPVYNVCKPIAGSANSKFYGLYLRNLALNGYVESLAKGIRERSTEFRYAELKEVWLPEPPIEEQKNIANFLDHETAKIDTLIDKQQQLIKLLKEKRQAVISHAVTKGLNPDAPVKDTGVEWLTEVPEHWELKPLKYLCRFSGGGTPSKDNLSYWENGNIPWVSPKDMRTFWLDDTQDKLTESAVSESSTNYVKPEALLMVVRSGILQRKIPIAINTVQVTLNQDMKALRFNHEMDVRFAANFILGNQDSLLLEWAKQGATVESIEHEYLANSLIPVPPVPEQLEINQFIEKKMEALNALEGKAAEVIELFRERRTALISAAVTGKIDVRNWQSPQNDVPMEVGA